MFTQGNPVHNAGSRSEVTRKNHTAPSDRVTRGIGAGKSVVKFDAGEWLKTMRRRSIRML